MPGFPGTFVPAELLLSDAADRKSLHNSDACLAEFTCVERFPWQPCQARGCSSQESGAFLP